MDGFDVVTLGEAMALFVTETPTPLRDAHAFTRSVAGAESNVAVGVARLGLRSSWCGRVGDDELGRGILDWLRGEGVDTTHAIVEPGGWTGVLVRDYHAERQVQVSYARRGSAGSRLSPEDVDPAWVGAASFLHVTGITPALSDSGAAAVGAAIAHARAAGVAVSLDVNYRRRLWTEAEAARALEPHLGQLDVLFAGEAELLALSGTDDTAAAAAWAAGLGVGTVIVKCGARGADAWVDGELIHAEPFPVTAVDPVGAGDGFAAGLPLAERLAQACYAGAAVAQVPGDTFGLPRGSAGVVARSGVDVDR